MDPLDAVRNRLQEIALTASTAAEALEGGRVDLFEAELARLLVYLDAAAGTVVEVCELLAAGVDPQARADADRRGPTPASATHGP